jgi:hypothetical protein
MEKIPDITSDMLDKLKKLNINSVYQLTVQSPSELADNLEAQVSQNTLKSIVNQTASTRAWILFIIQLITILNIELAL